MKEAIPLRILEPERKLLGGAPGDIPIVHTLYDTYVVWSQILLKFPKTQRYTLGETCSKRLLEAIELILAASAMTNMIEKSMKLREASAKIDVLKLLVRLSKDGKALSNGQYLDIESRLHETGKMLGGWIKSLG